MSTSNSGLLESPLYLGRRQPRLRPDQLHFRGKFLPNELSGSEQTCPPSTNQVTHLSCMIRDLDWVGFADVVECFLDQGGFTPGDNDSELGVRDLNVRDLLLGQILDQILIRERHCFCRALSPLCL